jgi:uncharacterized membrane protein
MTSLVLAALFFAGIHLGVAGTRVRDRITGAIGERIYLAAFSLASIAGIAWLIAAYDRAPYEAMWGPLEWWKPVAILLMLPSAFLVTVGLATPSPTAVKQEARVGERPQGIVRVTRHPFLVGVAIWALVHLVGNGDAASFVFFATFAIVALAGTHSIDMKRSRALGSAWAAFAARTSIVPFAASSAAGGGILREIGPLRTLAGVAVYVLFLALHGRIIGVSPFPD